jgi:PAS fold
MTGDSNREDLARLRHAERLLAAFSHSSAIGFGICDRELRYRCINKTLAASNGMLPEAHLGNTIQEVLGPVADVIHPSFRRVLATGQVTSKRVAGSLPSRRGTVSWIASYFPVKTSRSGVRLIGAIAIEVTELKKLDTFIFRPTNEFVCTRDETFRTSALELHRSVREYFANLNTYLTAVTQHVWDLDKGTDEQLAPAIASLDQRIVDIQSLVSAVASHFPIDEGT